MKRKPNVTELAARHAQLWNLDKVLRHAHKKGGIVRVCCPGLHLSVIKQREQVCKQLVANGILQPAPPELLCGANAAYQVTPTGLQHWRGLHSQQQKRMERPLVKITTDGSCWNVDKGGGYGIVMRFGEHTKEISGGRFENTTSARMEIVGMLVALNHLKPGFRAELYCDNQYVVNAVAKGWVFGWDRQNFEKYDEESGKNVERPNADLWRAFLKLWKKFPPNTVELKWVRGHAGDPDNERCDELAGLARKSTTILLYTVEALSLSL
jgi:ribonuclease HI